MQNLDTSGNSTRATQYFPMRLPHELRAKLDQAHALTGRPRASFLIAGAEVILAQILSNDSEAQSVDATGLLSTRNK